MNGSSTIFWRLGVAVLCLATIGDESPAADIKTAYDHLQRGRYAEASEAALSVEGEVAELAAAMIIHSRALEAQGDYQKALERIETFLKGEPENAPVLTRRAELLLATGKLAEAEAASTAALKIDEENGRARLVQARVFVETGRLKEADEAYRWFVRMYNRRQPNDAESLLHVAAGATVYARWHSVSSIFNFVINTLCPDALRDNPQSWQAYHVSGSLLLEKYNRAQSIPDLKKALTINPRSVVVLCSLADAAVQKHDFDDVALFVDQALEVQPNYPRALQLKADVLLAKGKLSDALEVLEQARAVNPVDQETLGRIAACHYLIDLPQNPEATDKRLAELLKNIDAIEEALPDSPTDVEAIVIEVAKRNSAPGEFLSAFAGRLETRRKFLMAEAIYLQAIRVMPQLSEPKTQLGMLYMQTGRTREAKELLDDAFDADPYHVRVSNMRKVLGVLSNYDKVMTDHFVIHVDSKADRILGEYMAEYLEEVYTELVEHYGYEPPQRTNFEIYNKAKGQSAHQWFSARMVGLPWIQTIGASTGMMVALASPTATGQPYNWARVVKHEFVHVVTLQQTRFNIPHWFTEALAVTSEGTERPAVWNSLLLERVPKGELASLDELNQIFVRPKTPLDWQFAYCQSRLYAQHMIEKYGADKIAGMLEAYRKNTPTKLAIPQVFGVSVEEFEKGYRDFLKKIVEEELGGSAQDAPLSLPELEKEYEADRENPAKIAAFAEAMLNVRRRTQAKELAERAIELNAKEPLAAVVLAQLQLLGRDLDDASSYLEAALDEAKPHKQVLGLLAQVRLMQGNFKDAARLYELGREKLGIGKSWLPGADEWMKGLAAAYVKLGETDKLRGILETVAQFEGDNLSVRKKLAQMALGRGDQKEAKKWAREGLFINVMDADVHQILLGVYDEAGDEKKAAREKRVIAEIESLKDQ
ncbi:MAG: tetratricopeptide repeat protein [Planctomycetota bacterium]|nr:tetratricopeptide repeat protein [Planctomycetota bacterium]